MKMLATVSLLCLVAAAPAFARDVLEMPEAKAELRDSVRFYLADKSPKGGKKVGQDFANAKTNAFDKTPEETCKWPALTALLGLHDRAVREGANVVVDIVSYNKHETFISPTDLQWIDGAFVGGVALTSVFVKTCK